MSELLVCKQLKKTYGMGGATVHALRGVDLSLKKGERAAIVGPSGSGKSTLLQILGCLDLPTSGNYKLNGIDVLTLDDDSLSELRGKTIGFVFQDFHLFQRLSLIENVALPLLYQDIPASERLEMASEALAIVKLDHRAKHKPHQLSGGEKQRGAIARAIVHKPPLILADEPTGNLDSAVKGEILDYLGAMNENFGVSVVLVTHDGPTASWAKRIFRFDDGQIVESDAP